MNRRSGAIVGAILGVFVVGGVFVGVFRGASDAAPTPVPIAVTTPDATVQPTAAARPTPSPSPVAVAQASPSPVPTAGPTAIPSTVRLPTLTPDVPGATKVRYFDVSGESPDALLDDATLQSQSSCRSADTLACVVQRPNISWTKRTLLATGACTIVAPRVSLRSTVYLPRWDSPKRVEPALLAWWQKMVDHMAWHEAQHIRIQKSYDSKLTTLLAGRRCSSANRIIRTWQRSVEAAQDKFDAKDALWRYPEYTGQAAS